MDSSYSLVIPVLRLEGNPHLPHLLKELEAQSHLPEEVHLVVGDCRQGRAINYGVSQVKTHFVGTLDDDSRLMSSDLFAKITAALHSDSTIGLAGSSCEIPEWASSLQKRSMKQIARRYFPLQQTTLDSDMVQHPCLMMSTSFFREIGGEDEELIRGLDPVLRKKVRDAGKRVVIVADTAVFHLLPDSITKLFSMYYRNGRGSGYAQRHFPHRVLELTDGFEGGAFRERRNLPYRLCRRIFNLLSGLLQGKELQVMTDFAYGLGVISEKFSPSSISLAPQISHIEQELLQEKPYVIRVHRVHFQNSPKRHPTSEQASS